MLVYLRDGSALCPSNMLVYLRDGSAQTILCCHTEIELADQTIYLAQSEYTDTWPTSPSADTIAPGRVATGTQISKSLSMT